MWKNLLVIVLMIALVCVYSYYRDEQGVNSKLTEDNANLLSDNSLLSMENIGLHADIARRDAVIHELEKLKGVVVSEITYYAPTGNRTKTGTVPEAGRTVAVDPNTIPLGSDVYIDGLGWRTAEDTGGAIDDTDVDVFVDSEEEATRGGRHHAYVLVREVQNED